MMSARDLASRFGALAAVLAIGLTLRLHGLTEWWLSPDEGIYYSTITRAEFMAFLQEGASNAHPPLYYLILRGVAALTGEFVWFRAFSVVSGMIAIVAVWAAARELARGVVLCPRQPLPETVTSPAPEEPAPAFGEAAGAVAALVLAISPGAIELSQVMRPYMFLLSGLAGALYFLVRYRNGGPTWTLWAYTACIAVALLTHYSTALALGVFGLFVIHEGIRQGVHSTRWQMMAVVQVLPGVLLAGLYVIHLSLLADSQMAEDALSGWLGPYMIDGPQDAWLAHVGFQHLVASPWFMGPTALFVLAAVAWSAGGRDRTIAVLTGGGLLVATAAATLGVYPFGATRHSTWLLAFTVPGIGWVGARLILSSLIPGRRPLTGAAILLLLFGGPLGQILHVSTTQWTLTDHVLRTDDLEGMKEALDPAGGPELMLMSAKTFYVLMPFYSKEREAATESDDGWLFHFTYGRRQVLVSRSWFFSAGSDRTARRHLARFFPEADAAFPALRIRERRPLVLLFGGWPDPVVDELIALGDSEPIGPGYSGVPGLHAFQLDMPLLLPALGVPDAR